MSSVFAAPVSVADVPTPSTVTMVVAASVFPVIPTELRDPFVQLMVVILPVPVAPVTATLTLPSSVPSVSVASTWPLVASVPTGP